MMKLLAWFVFIVMSVVAALHAYWGLGGLWPAASARELVDTVMGDASVQAIPGPAVTLPLAFLLFLVGVNAMMAANLIPFRPRWLVKTGTALLALVFILRGLSGFYLPFTDIPVTEPFATYDVRYYSPLILAVGLALATLFFAPRRTEV